MTMTIKQIEVTKIILFHREKDYLYIKPRNVLIEWLNTEKKCYENHEK